MPLSLQSWLLNQDATLPALGGTSANPIPVSSLTSLALLEVLQHKLLPLPWLVREMMCDWRVSWHDLSILKSSKLWRKFSHLHSKRNRPGLPQNPLEVKQPKRFSSTLEIQSSNCRQISVNFSSSRLEYSMHLVFSSSFTSSAA